MLRRLLIANRGEIARRINRVAQDMGLETVAVYSDADAGLPHVREASQAVRLGPAPARDSYLNVEALLAAARQSGADGVHPGYGFVSESAEFARACAGAGLTFVGPPPEAMVRMKDKSRARALAGEAGVPLVAGSAGVVADAAAAAAEAERIGYPVLVKAAGGGGGIGMAVASSPAELEKAFRQSSDRARSAFGREGVYLESYFPAPRHVELQILGDLQGHRIHALERECSIQRRHQKVVEECPSPVVDAALRSRLLETAMAAARAVSYTSCGTVEFLLGPDGSFYFLEMNTRLQVEHPVTEEVWGVDLAAAMIRIALGEPLPFSSESLSPRGHAIECRIYAEDPLRGFAPSPGVVTALRLPQGPGVRHDVGIEAGSVVPIDYDPMLGKLVVHAADRAAAIARLARALADYEVAGVETTLPLFRALAVDSEFRAAAFDVQWLDRRLESGWLARDPETADDLLLAAVGLAEAEAVARSPDSADATRSLWGSAARREALRGGY